MRLLPLRFHWIAGVLILFMWLAAGIAAQRGGNQGGAAGPATPGVGNPTATFPAQQRASGDPAMIARGNGLYGANCRLCHGADLRGGDQGGPNLLRSAVVLADQSGELISPVILNGRSNPGLPPMPKFSLAADDVRAIAEYLHSVAATMQGQGGPPRGTPAVLNVLVGDAAAGQAYFSKNCSGCHSATGDLAGIGARNTNPMQLQNAWLSGQAGGGGRGGNGGGGAAANPVMVTVTPPSGPKVEGRLGRIDDFLVIVNLEDGSSRSFRRNGDVPKVELRDPRDAHRKLLSTYTDKDIHDVTSYLVTLK
jgi:cytochrome c oxidase cbb3-type subunit 3